MQVMSVFSPLRIQPLNRVRMGSITLKASYQGNYTPADLEKRTPYLTTSTMGFGSNPDIIWPELTGPLNLPENPQLNQTVSVPVKLHIFKEKSSGGKTPTYSYEFVETRPGAIPFSYKRFGTAAPVWINGDRGAVNDTAVEELVQKLTAAMPKAEGDKEKPKKASKTAAKKTAKKAPNKKN